MADVTIVIPTRNGARVLGDQLHSLVGQDYAGDWELIIADNGSTDDTSELASSFSTLLPLRLIDAPLEEGAAGARNAGVAASMGSVILFLDDDDVAATDWLSTIVTAFEDDTVHVVGGGISSDFEHRRRAPRNDRADRFLPYGLGANLGIRKDVFERIGGFDTAYFAAQDVELCWRAQVRGFAFAHCPAAVVYRRGRDGFAEVWRQRFRYGRADAKLFARYSQHGMQRDWRATTRTWVWTLTRIPHAVVRSRRQNWARIAGRAFGRLKGSVENRVLYL